MSRTNLNYNISKKINLDTMIYDIQFHCINLLLFTLLYHRKIKTFNVFLYFGFLNNLKITFQIFQILLFLLTESLKTEQQSATITSIIYTSIKKIKPFSMSVSSKANIRTVTQAQINN